EVGDMSACRVRVAREREAAHDPAVLLGHQHRRVGMSLDRAQVAPLVSLRAPRAGPEDPPSLLAADALRELDERPRVLRRRLPHGRHVTTRPTPPRLGSPAASKPSLPVIPAAWTPPTKRSSSAQRLSSQVAGRVATSSSGQPPSRCTLVPSTWIRGAQMASATGSP